MTTLKRVMSGEEGPGAMGGYGGGYAAPPAYAAPYQQQPYGAAPGGFPAPPGAGGFPGLPPAPGVPGMRVNHGAEQAAAGVRVGEFHALNPNAACVAPQAALRLQQLWDGGNELVSLLDDKAWEGLSQLGAAEALSLVDETGGKLAAGQIRNVNAFIMSVARRMIQEAAMAPRYGAPPAGGAGGALYLLTPTLKATVEDMCRRHHPYLQLHHFDQSAASMLMRIGERDALIILGELDRTSMESIRSMPAFIMGMVKRHTGR
ncbi:MAG: hypothetical protein J3K34DRAFT_408521 [Monoraphidium minutum]|nr:MAG: hypothetical protein J3K34DRAFT_408521 [Monoraphidium minutum]